MDQGVIENIKHRYKKHLLRKFLLGFSEHDSFIEFAKSLTVKDAVFLSAKSWDEVSSLLLSRAWNKLGFGPQSDSLQEELPELSDDCNWLGITEAEKEEWLTMDDSETGVQELTDEDIIGMVQASSSIDDSDEEDEQEPVGPTITHSEAEEAFSIGLSWLEKQSEATPMKIVLFHELYSLAVKKKHDSLKQTCITDFFKS